MNEIQFTDKVGFDIISENIDVDNLRLVVVKNAITDEDIKIQVKPVITMSDVPVFIYRVIESIYDIENNNYIDEYKSFIIDKTILEMYTNIDLPDNLFDCYSFILSHMDLVQEIKNQINPYQLNSILQAINRRESEIVAKNIHSNENLDMLYVQISNLVHFINNIILNFDGAFDKKQLETLINNFGKLNISKEELIDKLIESNVTKPKRKTTNKVDVKVVK